MTYLPPIQVLLESRRRQRFAEERFTRKPGSQDLFIPKHIPKHIDLYFKYVSTGISRCLERKGWKRKPIYLGFAKHATSLPRRSSFILVQHEQTHFHPTTTIAHGTDPAIQEVVEGVRIHGGPAAFDRADAIIDYSQANISNVLSSSLKRLYDNKAHYIAPLFPTNPSNTQVRDAAEVGVMFGSPKVGRRKNLLDNLRLRNITSNVIHEFEDYNKAFAGIAILVNVSQTEYFRTPEELRILPALFQRVIVITEDHPSLRHLPYFELLETATIHDMPHLVEHVQANYGEAWHIRFGATGRGQSRAGQIFGEISKSNNLNFDSLVSKFRISR